MNKFKKIKKEVTLLINKIDPMDIGDPPNDEYDGEINQTISLYLDKKFTLDNLKTVWGSISGEKLQKIYSEVNQYFSKI